MSKILPVLKHSWQYRERHELEVRAALKANGVMDGKGQLRAWNKNTQDALDNVGHPKLDYKSCPCHQ